MARRNTRGLELSFHKQTGRWRKFIDGKCIHFGHGNGISDRESYKAALERYHAFMESKQKDEREAQLVAQYGPKPSLVPGNTWSEHEDAMKGWKAGLDAAQTPAYQAEAIRNHIENLNAKLAKLEGRVETRKPSKTVDELLTLFLADQQARNDARHFVKTQRDNGQQIHEPKRKNLSDGRFINIRIYTEKLRATFGRESWDGTEATAASLLKRWRTESEKLLTSEQITPNTFNERVKVARQFVGWCHKNYHLDTLPRDIASLSSKFEYKASAKAIPVETIRRLWEAANDRVKCYMALSLNLGFYAIDISELKDIDVQKGYLVKQRNKTGVPVKMKLWSVTQTLIVKNQQEEPDAAGYLFRGRNGKPLVWYKLDTGTRVDAVKNDFWRLCRDTKVKGFSFSNLRDTSSTMVENWDRTLTDLFDSHADGRQARFYVDANHLPDLQDKLDALIDRLEAVYGLVLSTGEEKQ